MCPEWNSRPICMSGLALDQREQFGSATGFGRIARAAAACVQMDGYQAPACRVGWVTTLTPVGMIWLGKMVRASDACTQTLESGSPPTKETKRNLPIGSAARLATSLLNSMLGNSSPLPMLRSSSRELAFAGAAGSL